MLKKYLQGISSHDILSLPSCPSDKCLAMIGLPERDQGGMYDKRPWRLPGLFVLNLKITI